MSVISGKLGQICSPISAKVASFFASRNLYRLRRDKLAGGVCSGCAKRLGLHPGLVRFYYAAICLFMPQIAIPYFVLWLAMPQEPNP